MNRLKTLIAEDEPLAQEGLAEWVRQLPELKLVGIRADGPAALQAIRELEPGLVLMDIQMPGMDGLETTRRLRALQAEGSLRQFPIIALTAHAMAADRQASLDAGMDEHLTKPIQLDQLRSVLRHWLSADPATA